VYAGLPQINDRHSNAYSLSPKDGEKIARISANILLEAYPPAGCSISGGKATSRSREAWQLIIELGSVVFPPFLFNPAREAGGRGREGGRRGTGRRQGEGKRHCKYAKLFKQLEISGLEISNEISQYPESG